MALGDHGEPAEVVTDRAPALRVGAGNAFRCSTCGCRNSSGHAEHAIRATDRIRRDASRPSRTHRRPENQQLAKAANSAKRLDPRIHPSDRVRGSAHGSDGATRVDWVDRAVPEILWVPETRPGILSRRFARRDEIRRDAAGPL